MPTAATADLVAIAVTGDDRVSHLDAVTTQRFLGVEPGSVLGWLVLDAKGGPLAMGWALVDEDRIMLLAPPAAADHVLDVLATRTFLADITFTRLDHPIASVGGPDLAAAMAAAGLDHRPDGWEAVGDGDVRVVRHAFGVELVGTADATTVFPSATTVPLDDLLVGRGEPRWGHEVVPGRLPEEYGLLATHVHLAKGCYPGQEPIAHMWMLGRPRRRLVLLGPRADPGAAHDTGSVDVEVTGRAGERGLGWVRPDVEPGTPVGDDLVVTGAVGAERDIVGWTPAQTRRRDREDATTLPGRRP